MFLGTGTTFGKRKKRGRKLSANGDPLSWSLTWLCSRESAMQLITCSTRQETRQEFYTNFIEENSLNQRRLFRASKRLLNVSRDDGVPPNLHAPTFVNDLGQYFVTKIETIQRKLDIESFDSVTSLFHSVTDDSTSVSVTLFTDFENVSTSDVALLIRRSALKSCPLDPMPSWLVSNCDALRPVIAAISLRAGRKLWSILY